MSKIKAIIIDDEKHCSATLEYELGKHCPDVQIIGTFNDPLKGKEAIVSEKPDLLFLDIEMPKLNGFELLHSLEERNFGLVFTTAYDDFAIKAFQFSALDYLLKPISGGDLTKAIDRFKQHEKNGINQTQLEILFSKLENGGFNKIALPSSGGLEFALPEEIMHCESDSNYTMVHFVERKKLLLSKTLKEVDEMLKGHGFFRIHHSHLVNLNHIKQYVKGSGGYVILESGVQVPVSRSKKDELMALFQSH